MNVLFSEAGTTHPSVQMNRLPQTVDWKFDCMSASILAYTAVLPGVEKVEEEREEEERWRWEVLEKSAREWE